MNNRSGFTLVELVVAILIFGIGICGIAKMQYVAVRGNAYAMRLSQATNAAENRMEWLMGLNYDAAELGGNLGVNSTAYRHLDEVEVDGVVNESVVTCTANDYDNPNPPGVNPDLTWKITGVSISATNPTIDVKRIELVAAWRDERNRVVTYTLNGTKGANL